MLRQPRLDLLGQALEVAPLEIPPVALEAQFHGFVDDGADGAGFEVFFDGVGFSEAQHIAVVELAVQRIAWFNADGLMPLRRRWSRA